MEQSYVSFPFSNTTLQFDFSSGAKSRNPHVMRGNPRIIFLQEKKITKQQQRNESQSWLHSKFLFNTYFSAGSLSSLLELNKINYNALDSKGF